jgi:hypothetical protein
MRRSQASCIIVALALAASSPALAQSDHTPRPTAPPPAREGNIYDHKDHQPTERDVGTAESAAGDKQQVEEEVRKLLQQTDRLDEQSEQRQRLPPEVPGG